MSPTADILQCHSTVAAEIIGNKVIVCLPVSVFIKDISLKVLLDILTQLHLPIIDNLLK